LRVKATRRQAWMSVTGAERGLMPQAATGLVVETSRHLKHEQALVEATSGVRPLARHAPDGGHRSR
jgi:hypothetical protein